MKPQPILTITERPGLGLEAASGPSSYRLGGREWAEAGTIPYDMMRDDAGTVLAKNGCLLAAFQFDDALRPGARSAVAALRRSGLALEIVSGDRPEPVKRIAAELGIPAYRAGVLPGDKTSRVADYRKSGRKVLMVGDGLNDAPALAAAHASMAPGSAADIGRNAADFVFLRDGLEAVPLAIAVSRQARRLVQQNFGLAIAYNVVALPVAVMGYVTPLVAALAMSLSSIIVVANALRLKAVKKSVNISPRETVNVTTVTTKVSA